MISMIAFRGSIELGLVYALMALGLFISYRILDVADLTVDGSFTLGAAVCVVVTMTGHPVLALFAAIIAGALAGCFTAFLQTKLFVSPILAGIISMTALYSINLRIMGNKPNISIAKNDSIITMAEKIVPKQYAKLFVTFIIVAIAAVAIVVFLYTKLGLQIRATGDNEDMVRSSSINVDMTKTVGLAIANALVALSGATLAQMQKFADISMGIGMVVIGLASLIIGEVIIGKRNIIVNAIAVIVGSIIYRLIIAFVLEMGIEQQDLKIISALIVTIAISYPAIKRYASLNARKKRGKNNVRA